MRGRFRPPLRGIRRWSRFILVGLAVLAIASWSTLSGLIGMLGTPKAPEPAASLRTLTVWVVTSDPRGIAVALNGLAKAHFRQISLEELKVTAIGTTVVGPTGVHDLLKDYMASPAPPLPKPFRLSWPRDPDPAHESMPCRIDVKFAPSNSLMKYWKRLFKRCSGEETLVTPLPGDLEWLSSFRHDLLMDANVVVLGPDTSDEVVALWLAMSKFAAGDGGKPISLPILISPGATSSLLSFPLGKCAYFNENNAVKKDGGQEHHPLPCWEESLGRMAGFSDDDYRHTTPSDRKKVDQVIENIKEASQKFIQYTRPGSDLAKVLKMQVVDVMGCRRVAILYPDRPVPEVRKTSLRQWLPHAAVERDGPPEHRLFGPTMRDDFSDLFQREASGVRLFFAPIPSPSLTKDVASSSDAWKSPAYFKQAERELLSTLRHFAHQRVEAVGVFGDLDPKIAILEMVRRELPDAILFTNDATYELESSRAPSAAPPASGEKASPTAAKSGETAKGNFEGLLIASGAEPPAEWVNEQFQALDPLITGDNPDAFLPDVHIYYVHHIFWKLIDLMQSNKALGPWSLPRGRRTHDGPCSADCECPAKDRASCLECLVRERFHTVGTKVHRSWDAQVAGRGDAVRLLIIRGGHIQLVEAASLETGLALASLALLTLLGLVGFHHLVPHRNIVAEIPHATVPTPRRAALLLTSYRVVLALAAVVVLIPLIDAFRGTPTSMSLRPDGHAVLPSVALQAVAALLMLSLGPKYRGKLNDLSDTAGEGKLAADVKVGVADHLRNSWREWAWTVPIGFVLTSFDLWVGLPIWPGRYLATLALFLFEWYVLALLGSVAWSFLEVGQAVRKLATRRENVAEVDPDCVRRLGTLFVASAADALTIFILLLVSRSPMFGMARWRWVLPMGRLDVPIGAIFFGLGLLIIAGYWWSGYGSLRDLIRDVKAARLAKLREAKAAPPDLSGAAQASREIAKAFEDQAQIIRTIPDRPWESDDSLRARLTLATALLTWLGPLLLGALSSSVIQPITQAIQVMGK